MHAGTPTHTHQTHTRQQRGFGFVTFADPESAKAAMNFWDGQDYKGRRMRVRA